MTDAATTHSAVNRAVPDAGSVWLPLEALRPWEKNPRTNDGAIEKVAASIREFGFVAPIVVWRAGGRMVAGHTRLKALRSILAQSPDFVPPGAPGPGLARVVFQDFESEAKADLYALADNKLGELAAWDDEAVADILAGFNDEEIALAGFDDEEVLAGEEPEVAGGDDEADDEAPSLPANPVTRLGDVWQLGDHRLLCGDCRSAADVGRLLGGARVNVAITSPPYASQRKYDEASGFRPIAPDNYVAWFEAVQDNVRACLADDGSWFVNIKEHCEDGQRSLYVKDLTLAHVRRWGWRFVDEFCWHKTAVPGSWPNRFRNAWEPVFHYCRAAQIRFRPDATRHVSDRAIHGTGGTITRDGGSWGIPEEWDCPGGLALPENVLRLGTGGSESMHSAAFPVGLPAFFIKAFSDPGDVVFDPFMGSGTTLIACERLDRRGYGIEISPAYCDVIVKRWETATGKTAVREPAADAA